ncbi:MAG: hypothetical protein WD021_02815 [Rhodothermales bacterium]
MELRIDIHGKVIEWLSSMGYPVSGMPVELLRGMLLREARQWQVSPERLETMILEEARQPDRERTGFATFERDPRAVAGVSGTTVEMAH